jgi:hypothetical protein
MSRTGDMYMLPDDADDLLGTVTDFVGFHKKLGEIWAKYRNAAPIMAPKGPLYSAMPNELVDLLDELGGVVRCEQDGCRAPCHGDWDFCKLHGEFRKDHEGTRSTKDCPECKGIDGVHRLGCKSA